MLLILSIFTILLHCLNGCTVNVDSCTNCESSTFCSSCLTKSYLQNGECESCPIGCQTCVSAYTCYGVCVAGFQGVQNHCRCYKGQGLLSNGDCAACAISNCEQCFDDYQRCEKCAQSTGIDKVTFQCSSCSDPQCISCPKDYTACISCSPGFSVQMGSCLQCTANGCIACLTDKDICTACQSGKGWNGTVCQPCQTSGCEQCSKDSSSCEVCQTGKSIYGNTCQICNDNCTVCSAGQAISSPSFDCVLCSTTHTQCKTCNPSNVLICNQCNSGFGKNQGLCQNCIQPNCRLCGADYRACQKCNKGYGIKDTFKCAECPNNCDSCQNYDNCTTCSTGYYYFFGVCVKCNDTNCKDCPYGVENCLTCKVGYERIISPIHYFVKTCKQICGDSNTSSFECDNPKARPFDGCDDNCEIMPDFDCLKLNGVMNSTMCSYNKNLTFQVKKIVRKQEENKLRITILVYPNLWAFSQLNQTQMNSLFNFKGDGVQLSSLSYDKENSQFTFTFDFSQNLLRHSQLYFLFLPSLKYFGPTLKTDFGITMPQNYDYYSSSVRKFMQVLSYLFYLLIIIAWICCAASLYRKKLSGLEALMVLQVGIVCFIFLQSNFLYYYKSLKGARFGLGGNFWLSGFDEQNVIGVFAVELGLSSKLFSNNFNICLLLQLICVIAMIVTFVQYKRFQKEHQNQQVFIEIEKQNKQILQKLEQRYEFCLQSFVYTTMVNLINFIVSTALFIKFGTLAQAASWILFIIYLISLIAVLGFYHEDPHGFGFFRYSFRMTYMTFYYFWIFICGIVLFACFSASIPRVSYMPIIPIGLLLLHVIIFRPFTDRYENIRSAINLLVMGSFCGFKIYVQSLDEGEVNSDLTFYYFMVNFVVLLSLVYVLCILSLVIGFYQQKDQNIIKNEFEIHHYKVLKELVVTNVHEKIKKLKSTSVFRGLPNQGRLLPFSIDLRSQYEQSIDKQKCLKFQRPILCEQTSKQNIQKRKLIRRHLKQSNINKFNIEQPIICEEDIPNIQRCNTDENANDSDKNMQTIVRKVLVEQTEYIKYKEVNKRVNGKMKKSKETDEYYLDRYDSI